MRYSTIKPEDRTYCKGYRSYLEDFEGKVVKISGVISKIKHHPTEAHLTNVLLTDLEISLPNGEKVCASHIWVLEKQLKKIGLSVDLYERVSYHGSVYPYYRLGGRSKERGMYKEHDFGILPVRK